ncbi:hypothetical protein Acr_02g0014090 [Actinidia rufa]|uniref:Transmembrane protein n=1 Tax=Actinidia rufa TaxID=165716 RepID=A0A7J0EB65_9ERIC|nr:hypothetical protein Acr_02g0014090 [Actinidia rufa]
MALRSLLSLAVLGLCAFLLLTQPQQALGSSRGPLGLIGGEVIAPPPGNVCNCGGDTRLPMPGV